MHVSREYSKVGPRFWVGATGKKIRTAGKDAQIVAFYLMTSPHANMLGLYYLPIPYIAHETGLSIEGAWKGLRSCIEAGFCAYDEDAECVWVYEMARHQIGERLDGKDKRCQGVQNQYDYLQDNKYLADFFSKYAGPFQMQRGRESASPSEAPSKPLPSQEKEKEKDIYLLSEDLSGLAPDAAALAVDKSTAPPQDAAPPPKNGQHSVAIHLKDAEKVLQYLNDTTARNFQMRNPNGKLTSNAELVINRLREGYTQLQLCEVVFYKAKEWDNDDKMHQYLRPETLFSKRNFEQYLGAIPPEDKAR